MKRLKIIIANLISILGTIIAIYVGGYLMFVTPLRNIYLAIFEGGGITKTALVLNVIAIFLASTVSGAIWVIFDILSYKFRDKED